MTAPTYQLLNDGSQLLSKYITVPRTFVRVGDKTKGISCDGARIKWCQAELLAVQQAPDLPVGVDIQLGKNGWLFKSTFKKFCMELEPTRYWNGDGVSSEVNCEGWVFEEVNVFDNQDGGFDLKSPAMMKNVEAAGNGRNFRFWNGMACTGFTRSRNPWIRGGISGPAHFHVQGPSLITIENLELENSKNKAAVFTFENNGAGAHVRIKNWKMVGKGLLPGTPLQYGSGGTIDWGPQGKPVL